MSKPTDFSEVPLDFLSELERREARLLSWGVVDAGFTKEELEAACEKFLSDDAGRSGLTTRQILGELFERRLIFECDSADGLLYRTRMAETVRLCARLRQLFPTHMKDGGWRTAPTLVADYRLVLRPRSYPKREFPPSEVLSYAKKACSLAGTREAALDALLQHNGASRELARFQREALAALLSMLEEGRSRGVIVGAGTGSGKTLAFYLPALTHIAACVDGSYWTKALAVYPRNELLKDQFTDTYREARRLDATLTGGGRRKVLIGAYFGPTPRSAGGLASKGWQQLPDGWVCPFIRCPVCDSEMMWAKQDVAASQERLRCRQSKCAATISSDEVMLTRARMERTPPDVLFTTTEMLNRNLGNSETRHIFGIGPKAARGPDLVLLDEVHTYSGTSGAQTAMLLRRWRYALGRPVRFVGLSATLRDAGRFFARLVGLPESDVTHIEPAPSDMMRAGMEYMLALRGDPASGASTLATTIQASMLLRRMLDEPRKPRSGGVYGTKLFVFTDNLDIVNRLYFNLQDAEALDSFGKPLASRPFGSLAALRSREHAQVGERASAGQVWSASEKIGHVLTADGRLRIERTSSQDAGVDAQADIVVATASLEVGFNDPAVGAVLQHKAPLDPAQFLQRKGRAGRQRSMRPWTVVVLSDYGRDRMAYQGYEMLFDPILEARHLPTGNRHVLRIHAVQAMADWLAASVAKVDRGSIWDDLSGPADVVQKYRGMRATNRQRAILERLESVLSDELVRGELADYLGQALRISADEVQALLWDPPRALLTAVIPTIMRRIETQWGRVPASTASAPYDTFSRWNPLPDFVPANLFSDLDLPEVIVVTPPQAKGGEPEERPMPVSAALREFAPGRVSRRFGVLHRYARHWVPVADLQASSQTLPVTAFCSHYERLGPVQVRGLQGEVRSLELVRPHRMILSQPPREIGDTSNGRLEWRSQLWPLNDGAKIEVPNGTPWTGLVEELRFFTHSARSGVEVRRFAPTSSATLAFDHGVRRETTVRFVEGDGPDARAVAPGFAFRADGCVVRFRFPEKLDADPDSPNQQKIRGCRWAHFQHMVEAAAELDGIANRFQRIWLAQVYASAVVMLAIQQRITIREATDRLQDTVTGAMKSVLKAIFQTLSDDASDPSGDGRPAMVQRVHAALVEMIANPQVAEVLFACGESLWAPPSEEYYGLTRERFRSTLAAAVLQACEALCPEFGVRDLLVDLDAGPRPSNVPGSSGLEEIWLTEDGPGGGGIVEEVGRRVAEDPRRFFRLVEAALLPSDFAMVDTELRKTLTWAIEDPAVRSGVAAVRDAIGHQATWQAFEGLRDTLSRKGAVTSHAVMAALSARVLRPGSSHATDCLLRDLVQRWIAEEERLGVEVDARVFAYVCAEDEGLDGALEEVAAWTEGDRRQWRFGTVSSLLWPRGTSIRAQALLYRSPYAEMPLPDPDLVADEIRAVVPQVKLGEDDWDRKLAAHLSNSGSVQLIAGTDDRRALGREALALLSSAIDVGGLLVYPRIAALQTKPDSTSVIFEIREVLS